MSKFRRFVHTRTLVELVVAAAVSILAGVLIPERVVLVVVAVVVALVSAVVVPLVVVSSAAKLLRLYYTRQFNNIVNLICYCHTQTQIHNTL